MDSFDKKIKELAKNEVLEVPDRINNKLNYVLKNIDSPKKTRRNPLKVAMIVLALTTATITSAFAIETVIDYFRYNTDSTYIHSKNELEKLGSSINLKSKDKGIELNVNSIAIDNNFLNIFYTIKSDKNIKELDKAYNDLAPHSPTIRVNANNKPLLGNPEYESAKISDNEMKAVYRISIANIKLDNNFELKIYTNNLLNQKGHWSISTKVDKTKGANESYEYFIRKDSSVTLHERTYTNPKPKLDKFKDVTINFNIDKVVISPLGSQIIIGEKTTPESIGIGSNFALFDENKQSLDIIDKGSSLINLGEGPITSFEFLKANKDTKSLSLVPIQQDYSKGIGEMLPPENIDKLPVELKATAYGKVVIEDIQLSEKQIKITYYKDGVVPYTSEFFFFDENGKRIDPAPHSFLHEPVTNNYTGRYTYIVDCSEPFKDFSKIKKISMYESHIKLLYDQEIKFDLKNKNN